MERHERPRLTPRSIFIPNRFAIPPRRHSDGGSEAKSVVFLCTTHPGFPVGPRLCQAGHRQGNRCLEGSATIVSPSGRGSTPAASAMSPPCGGPAPTRRTLHPSCGFLARTPVLYTAVGPLFVRPGRAADPTAQAAVSNRWPVTQTDPPAVLWNIPTYTRPVCAGAVAIIAGDGGP